MHPWFFPNKSKLDHDSLVGYSRSEINDSFSRKARKESSSCLAEELEVDILCAVLEFKMLSIFMSIVEKLWFF